MHFLLRFDVWKHQLNIPHIWPFGRQLEHNTASLRTNMTCALNQTIRLRNFSEVLKTARCSYFDGSHLVHSSCSAPTNDIVFIQASQHLKSRLPWRKLDDITVSRDWTDDLNFKQVSPSNLTDVLKNDKLWKQFHYIHSQSKTTKLSWIKWVARYEMSTDCWFWEWHSEVNLTYKPARKRLLVSVQFWLFEQSFRSSSHEISPPSSTFFQIILLDLWYWVRGRYRHNYYLPRQKQKHNRVSRRLWKHDGA